MSVVQERVFRAFDQLRLRAAVRADLNDVIAILSEAARWLADRGIQQWPSPFPRAVVESDFEENCVWVATIDATIIATASILQHDPLFWGDLGGDAWYLHRLAIRREFAGSGRTILSLIEQEAVKGGAECVRLDCGPGLRGYYEESGYAMRSMVSLVNPTSSPPRSLWYCYEKRL